MPKNCVFAVRTYAPRASAQKKRLLESRSLGRKEPMSAETPKARQTLERMYPQFHQEYECEE
jgi:hypothetical protein